MEKLHNELINSRFFTTLPFAELISFSASLAQFSVLVAVWREKQLRGARASGAVTRKFDELEK